MVSGLETGSVNMKKATKRNPPENRNGMIAIEPLPSQTVRINVASAQTGITKLVIENNIKRTPAMSMQKMLAVPIAPGAVPKKSDLRVIDE